MKHLAQINIGRLLYPQDDPRVADFFNNLDRVNAAAERMPGFVWRLKDDSGNATSISAYEDPTLIVNMSVWESAETFEKFVWQTVHTNFYRRRTGLVRAARRSAFRHVVDRTGPCADSGGGQGASGASRPAWSQRLRFRLGRSRQRHFVARRTLRLIPEMHLLLGRLASARLLGPLAGPGCLIQAQSK